MSVSQWCHQPSPLSSPSPPTFNLSQVRSFLMSWLFTSGGQSLGASASVWICVLSCSVMSDSVTPCIAYEAPLSIGFFRQEYWSGLPCPLLGDLSNTGIKPSSPTLRADCLPSELRIQGLISFRIDWFDLRAVQGTLKSLLQHHNSKASILRRSASV